MKARQRHQECLSVSPALRLSSGQRSSTFSQTELGAVDVNQPELKNSRETSYNSMERGLCTVVVRRQFHSVQPTLKSGLFNPPDIFIRIFIRLRSAFLERLMSTGGPLYLPRRLGRATGPRSTAAREAGRSEAASVVGGLESLMKRDKKERLRSGLEWVAR